MKIAMVAPGHKKITDGVHGGGQQSCKDIAKGLSSLGHEIILVGHPETDLQCVSRIFPYDETEKNAIEVLQHVCKECDPDVIFDSSAYHIAHDIDYGVPRVNRLPQPRVVGKKYDNTVINSSWMQKRNPGKLIKTAVPDDGFESLMSESWEDYIVYSGRDYPFKGYQYVQQLKMSEVPIISIENVDRDTYLQLLSKAKYLLHPSIEDAAPRAPVESALVGVPTICLDMSGTVDQVINNKTGYICKSINELFRAAISKRTLSSLDVRLAISEDRSYDNMIKEYEETLEEAINGKKW